MASSLNSVHRTWNCIHTSDLFNCYYNGLLIFVHYFFVLFVLLAMYFVSCHKLNEVKYRHTVSLRCIIVVITSYETLYQVILVVWL